MDAAEPALDGRVRLLLQAVAARVLEVTDDELVPPPRRRSRVLGLLELLAIALMRDELPLDGDAAWRRAENHPCPTAPDAFEAHRRQLAKQRRERVAERTKMAENGPPR